jgi:hypothetical protein
MGKKRRSRQRQRFTPRPAPLPAETHEERGEAREEIRPRFTRRGAMGRAGGQPSNALLKAAAVEYGFVIKDLRRIGLVAGGLLLILAVVSVAANALLR